MPVGEYTGKSGFSIACEKEENFTRETSRLYANKPDSRKNRSIATINPFWDYFYQDEQLYRCIIDECDWAIKSRKFADAIPHLCHPDHKKQHDEYPNSMSSYLSLRNHGNCKFKLACKCPVNATFPLTANDMNLIREFLEEHDDPAQYDAHHTKPKRHRSAKSNEETLLSKVGQICVVLRKVTVINRFYKLSSRTEPLPSSSKQELNSELSEIEESKRQIPPTHNKKEGLHHMEEVVAEKRNANSTDAPFIAIQKVERHSDVLCDEDIPSSKMINESTASTSKFLALSKDQQFELYAYIKMKIKELLKTFGRFNLFVKLHLHSNNRLFVLVSVSRYLLTDSKFETIHLDVLLLGVSDLVAKIDWNLKKILSDFELDIKNIKRTIIECPPKFSYLCTRLKNYEIIPSFRQKLSELSDKLRTYEATTSSSTTSNHKKFLEAVNELNSTNSSSPTFDCYLPFIEKLQQMFKDDVHEQTLLYDIFGFVFDPECEKYCVDFVVAKYLNLKLAVDMYKSKINAPEKEIQQKMIQFPQQQDLRKEFKCWESSVALASLTGMHALLKEGSKVDVDNFNPVIFWTEMEEKYPVLSEFAIDLLCTPSVILQKQPKFNELNFDDFKELKRQAMRVFNRKFF